MCTPYSQSVVVLLLWSGGAEKQKKGIEPFQKVSPEATLKSKKKKRERGGNEQKQKCSKKTGIRGEELGVYNINSHTSMLQF